MRLRSVFEGEKRSGLLLVGLVALAACSTPPETPPDPASPPSVEPAASLSSREGSARVSARRPNLVFLLTDDQRWDTLGAFGNPVIETPNLDRLAAEGMLFTNAFVTTSICSVSRASLLSGQYAHRHRIGDFRESFSGEAFAQTFPVLLREAGYTTGSIGKWGIAANRQDNLDETGEAFDYWAGTSHQANYWHERSCRYVTHDGRDRQRSNVCDCPPDSRGVDGPMLREGHQNIEQPTHLTIDTIPEKVDRFLASRAADKPFLLLVSFKAPHMPFEDWHPAFGDLYEGVAMPAPVTATSEATARMPEFLNDSLGRRRGVTLAEGDGRNTELQEVLRDYYRLITGVDAAVGRIRAALETHHVAENTVIVFTSDNGHLMAAHGLFGKWLMYEESIRVPLIVYDPRLPAAARGRTCDEMVLNIDVAPTILDLAGISVPPRMQGQSMVGLLTRPETAFRESWFYEHLFSPPAPRRIERSEGVRTRRFKYIRYLDQEPPYEELYDLQDDPYETRNLIRHPKYQDALAELRQQYQQFHDGREKLS